MPLPALLQTAGEFLVMRTEIVDKLLQCGDGDGALLYLYALRHTTDFQEKTAARELGFPPDRFDRALFTLSSLELTTSSTAPHPPEKKQPAYRASELRGARTGDHRFSAVCDAAEAVLGRALTEGQLRSLFSAYDYLGLPAEVIIELLSYLKREKDTVRRSDIDQEAALWADMGLFTVQNAAEYLARRDAEKPLLESMRVALQLPDRPFTAVELRNLSSFISMGFPAESVALAAARTRQSLGKFSWKYLAKILASWDQKGIHTVSEITAVEPGRASSNSPATTNTTPEKLETWEQQWLEEAAARRRRRQEEER